MQQVQQFVQDEFAATRQREDFFQQYALSVLPLFKARRQVDAEKAERKRRRQQADRMRLRPEIVQSVSLQDAEEMRRLFLPYFADVTDKEQADLHGAAVRVVRSRCCGFVGIEGTVVQELPDRFVLIKADGGLVQIPKRLCDLLVEGEHLILGAHRSLRPRRPKHYRLSI